MSANSVSALAYRAREGLRQAFLTQHAAELDEDTCRWTHGQLGAYVRGAISRRDAAKVEHHLDECRSCMAIYLELTEVNSNLGALLAPLLLGGVATAYLGGTAVSAAAPFGVGMALGRIRDLVTGNAGAAAVAGVAVSAVVVAGGVALGLGGPDTPASAPTRAATSESAQSTDSSGSTGPDGAASSADGRAPGRLRSRSGTTAPARVLPPGDVDVTPGSVPGADTTGSDATDRPSADPGHRPRRRHRPGAGHRRPDPRTPRRTPRRTPPRPHVEPHPEPDARPRRPTRPRIRARPTPHPEPDRPTRPRTRRPTPRTRRPTPPRPDHRPDLEPHPHPGPDHRAARRRRLGHRQRRRGAADVHRRGAGRRSRGRHRAAADRGLGGGGGRSARPTDGARWSGPSPPARSPATPRSPSRWWPHGRQHRGRPAPAGSDADRGNNTWTATLG